MSRIEVGMLVKIVSSQKGVNAKACVKRYIGHVGIVLARSGIGKIRNMPMYDIEGADPENLYWAECDLDPINPDSTPADAEWQEDFKRMLREKVT